MVVECKECKGIATIKRGNKEVRPIYRVPIQINPWNKVSLYSLN